MVNSCAICGFKRSKLASRIFHNLPRNPEVRKQWLKVLRKKETCEKVLVCSKHFITEDYRPLCDKPLLKQGVIPKLNLESNTNEELTENDDDNEINLENSTTERDSHEKRIQSILNNIPESDSQEIPRSDLINDPAKESTVPTEINESLKRKNDSSNDSSTPSNKRHLNDYF